MKALNRYITEKFQVSKDSIKKYKYYPINRKELIEIILEKIEQEGLGTKDNPLNLNDIDTSEITSMWQLFDAISGKLYKLSKNGYFDISEWDVGSVEDMSFMFHQSNFNGDLSDWNVSNVKDMYGMFAESEFSAENGDISDWDVSNVDDMKFMFYDCPLQNNPPEWYHE